MRAIDASTGREHQIHRAAIEAFQLHDQLLAIELIDRDFEAAGAHADRQRVLAREILQIDALEQLAIDDGRIHVFERVVVFLAPR